MNKQLIHPWAWLALVPSMLPLPWIWFLVAVVPLGITQYFYIRHQLHLKRNLLFNAYIDKDSALMRFRAYSYLVPVQAVATTVFLAPITAVSFFANGWVRSGSIIVGAYCGAALGRIATESLLINAKQEFRPYYELRWTNILAVISAAVLFVLVDFGLSLGDFSDWDARTTANTVIEKTNHPAKWVQDIGRTLDYIHYTKLRLRDSVGSFGWLVYIFMIIPNVFPIFGATCVLIGTSRIFEYLSENQQDDTNTL
jgi:hypothetical protein